MIGIPIALAFENAGEWAIHKYVLHGLGRRKGSFFAFHWQHHKAARANGFRDPGYERSALAWNPQGKEAFAMVALGAAYAPLLPVFPFFTLTVWWRMLAYWRTHKRAHLDPEWARTHLPWHWNHHMSSNPNRNWCVTHPWFDRVMGTLDPFETEPTADAVSPARAD